MNRKKLIEALRDIGKTHLSNKNLEDCYTVDLVIALREEKEKRKLRITATKP